MLGYSAAEMVGSRAGVIHDQEEIAERARELGVEPGMAAFTGVAEGSVHTGDWTYIRKDGTRVPVSLTITPMRSAGAIVGLIGIARDVT